MATDDDISRRYRELPRDEPPRHLDEAILAAARRSVRPKRRWYVPLAAAAVIMLAVAVTLHVDREQPADEVVTSAPQAMRGDATESRLQSTPAPQAEAPKTEAIPPADLLPPPQPQAPAPEAAVAAARAMPAERKESFEQPRAKAAPALRPLVRAPEQWLQGIADLRKQGRHEEADRELAEFRRQYSDYQIHERMLERIERR